MKNSQKGFAPLILLLIVAALAVGGGAYAYKKHENTSKGKQDVSVHATSTNATNATSTNSSHESFDGDPAQLKTYTNVTLGISLKYPANWKIAYETSNVVRVEDAKHDSKSDTDSPYNGVIINTTADAKVSSDWAVGFGGTYTKTIYNNDKNTLITLLALTKDDEKVEDAIASSITFTEKQSQAAQKNTFLATPITGNAPLTVKFTNTFKSAGDMSINYGDGAGCSTANPNGDKPCVMDTHTYTKAGTYTAILYRHLPTTELSRVTITVK